MATSLFKLSIVSLPVSDWQRAKSFYTETLGLPVARITSDEIGWMEFGEEDNVHLAIYLWEDKANFPQSKNGCVPIFAVVDAHAAIAELRRKGVRCEDPIGIPDMVTAANFFDPDGNRLQVAGPPPKG
jgi:predicted enzyme related to lactoylglutathione lyase